MIRLLLFITAILLCALYAFRAGSQPERAAIIAQIIALILTYLQDFWLLSDGLVAPAWGWLAIDLLLLAALAGIALRANRIWTMVLAGLQLASIFAHLAKIAFPSQLAPMAYAVLLQVWAWPMLATTAFGINRHRRRAMQHHFQPDWKPTVHGWGAQEMA